MRASNDIAIFGSVSEQTPNRWRGWNRAPERKTNPPVLVRFTAASGEVWTVWDTTFSKFKHHRQPHCDPVAKERVFVNAAGVRRSYTFKKGETRVLDPATLERQLRDASFAGDRGVDGRLPR